MSFYQIKSEVWLSKYDECYKKIIIISPKPTDPSLIAITKLFNYFICKTFGVHSIFFFEVKIR